MYLKNIRAYGFKSFADKIDLESESQVVYYIENGKATREI